MGYWTFTDIFEEAGPRMEAFHGGFGLMNTQGIKKPAYFAYQFLNNLAPSRVAKSSGTKSSGVRVVLNSRVYMIRKRQFKIAG